MIRRIIWMTSVAVLVASPVFAQAHAGIRAGVSADPDQFFFGGHIETNPIAEHLTFRPNAEIGVGDHLVLIALNIEFAYWVPMNQRRAWALYFGAGPAANIFSFKDDRFGRDRDSDVGGGFNILVGGQHRDGLFTELKVGAIDSPTLKLTVGYQFK